MRTPDEQLIADYEAGMSAYALAQRDGRVKGTIHKRLKMLGVEIRSFGLAMAARRAATAKKPRKREPSRIIPKYDIGWFWDADRRSAYRLDAVVKDRPCPRCGRMWATTRIQRTCPTCEGNASKRGYENNSGLAEWRGPVARALESMDGFQEFDPDWEGAE